MVRQVQGLVLEDEPRFEVWNFQVRSNTKWKFYPFFDDLCSKNLWFGSRFGLFWEVWRFEVQFQRTNLGSEGSRLSFLKVQYFQFRSNSIPHMRMHHVHLPHFPHYLYIF